MIDDGTFVPAAASERRFIWPFEINGVFQGQPADLDTALREIDSLRHRGATHLIQTWQAFWWNSHYEGFDAYMNSESRCLIANERCRIYEFDVPHGAAEE